jgi:hypothetical protein
MRVIPNIKTRLSWEASGTNILGSSEMLITHMLNSIQVKPEGSSVLESLYGHLQPGFILD